MNTYHALGRQTKVTDREVQFLTTVISAIPPAFYPTASSRLEGHPTLRSPEQLRLHRALEELGGGKAIDEFNDAAWLTNSSVTEPILITTNGTSLAGFGRWRLAVFERRREIHCADYPLSEDESLTVHTHAPSNPARLECVCLHLLGADTGALFSLDNMRAGGKYKGWAHSRLRSRLAGARSVVHGIHRR
jgi:hypothetical protein